MMSHSLKKTAVLAALAFLVSNVSDAAPLSHGFCRTHDGTSLRALLNGRVADAQRGVRARAAAQVSQVGEVAVIRDQGDLLKKANPIDLQGKGLEFLPGYTASLIPQPVGPDGTLVRLGDDATLESPLPFAFPFFGAAYDKVFINSDGNLTFTRGDASSTDRDLARLVSGPPRIAPLLADLDPSAGGSVTTTARADVFIVKWTNVPQFGVPDKNTFQVSLFPNGRIVFAYDPVNLSPSLSEGVVGISAGGGAEGLSIVDLTATAATAFTTSIAESFSLENDISLTAIARALYSAYSDDFNQIVVYTNRTYIPRSQSAFAYQSIVRNEVGGIGTAIGNGSAAYGSGGKLESIVMMDRYEKYSENPTERVLREETSLSVLAHEVGHRWLTRVRYNDGTATNSDLLGRQQAHWSFYVHSAGSHDEGNDIQDLGGGAFRTGPSSQRYGPLDQYLMGIRMPEEVPPLFVIKNPVHDGEQSAERAPQSNVDIKGTRKDVPLAQIIAALGERTPPARSAGAAPWRIAFVYVTDGGSDDPVGIARINTIRAQFEGFFQNSTEGRWSVETRLR